MPAETVDTYPMTPPDRGVHSPENIDEDIKDTGVPRQPSKQEKK